MGRRPRLADESFLPELSLDDLKKMYDAEENKRDAQKILVAYHYKAGKTIQEAADAACTEYMNAWRWTGEMYKRGPDALSHRKPPGAARWLTRDEYIQIVIDVYEGPRACGFKTNVWTYILIHKHVCKKFKVEIGYRALVRNLHELRIVIKAPRTSHPDAASPEERAEFQRETRKKILACARRGLLPLFLDEAFPQSYKNSRKTVGIKGDKTTVPASVERASLPLFGVLGDGFCFLKVIGGKGRANTATLIEFSERVFELFGPVQYIYDHASYHKSKKFDRFAEENWRYLERHLTLVYTPNDNSVEGQWKLVLRALANVSLRSRGHMNETLGEAVRAGEVPPVGVAAYARVGTRRLSPSEARAIESKIGEDEHFCYRETEPPGRIRLPGACELEARKGKVLTPEMRAKLPPRLANSGLPEAYLADPPELLLRGWKK